MTIGFFVTQDDDADADEHEGEQGPYVSQVNHLIDAHYGRKATDDHASQNRGDVRSLELGMDLREHRRQQTIARHRKEDARLAQLKDE